MSIRRFKTLVVVCERGSFAAAAEALNLTQSAVSMQISALEDALGVALFDRKRRPMRLTRQGRRLLERARPMVMQYDRIVDEITEASSVRGTFSLGAIPTVLTNLMPAALVELRVRKPELTINVSSGLSGRLHRLVGSGELDGAVMHRPDTLADGFHWSDITRQTVMIIAPPDSVGETPSEVFAEQPYIRFGRHAWVAPMIERRLADLQLTPEVSAEIESIEAIQIMVGLGFGASVIPVGSAPGQSLPGLRMVEFGSPQLFRTIGLLSRIDTRKKSERHIISGTFAEVAAGSVPPVGGSIAGWPGLVGLNQGDSLRRRNSPG